MEYTYLWKIKLSMAKFLGTKKEYFDNTYVYNLCEVSQIISNNQLNYKAISLKWIEML